LGTTDLLVKVQAELFFNIGGNTCRMICKYAFGEKEVHLFICWVGTHSEYDKLNMKEEQCTISSY